jgi:hypothetical protein
LSQFQTVAVVYFLKAKARFAPSSMMFFDSHPFEPVTSFQQPKEVTKKGRSLPKFLTAQKYLF